MQYSLAGNSKLVSNFLTSVWNEYLPKMWEGGRETKQAK